MTMRSDAARLALAALLALSPLAAFAHGDTGPNGGQYVHQGAFHVEFLPQGNQLRFLVSDEAEKAVETAGATASLTILENGASRVVQPRRRARTWSPPPCPRHCRKAPRSSCPAA